MDSIAWHAKEKAEILEHFSVDEAYGLSNEEIEKRLSEYGVNAFEKKQKHLWVGILVKQFTSPLVFILFFAFVGALYLGESLDATVIAIAMLVNIVISFAQEYRANRALEALAASQERDTVVFRDGERKAINVETLVPGDIVVLSSGNVVPADGRLLTSSDFSVSEAHITGESLGVNKKSGTVGEDAEVYERTNMVYMGSPVLTGEARAVIVATGGKTEMGDIAEGLSLMSDADTPIEKSVRKLARFLSFIVAGVVALLVVVGLVRDIPLPEIMLLAIALAVSVIPEGLPAAVTAILAIGMERILKKRGLVRNLLAAETLGSTTVILTDKTGTLTQSKLALVDVVAGEERGYIGIQLSQNQIRVLQDAMRVSDAYVTNNDEEKALVGGRPVERAIMSAALERRVFPDVFEEIKKRIDFLSFSSEKRFSGALYPGEGKGTSSRAYFLGAPEILLQEATMVFEDGKEVPLTKTRRDALEKIINGLAHEGKRVIGVGFRDVSEDQLSRSKKQDVLHGATYSGLIAFADPVREDVPAAIRQVHEAGVRVIMVTGDTPQTAYSIAVAAGIAKEGEEPLTGRAIEHMNDDELYDALMHNHVCARVLPKQKQRLVSVLQERGEIVAMTGDGVNDAPALKAAAIGVAVGSGTSVAREASDLVLLDDSFSIVVSAIQEGRRIMDNLKKATVHLIATSFHEVFIISVAVLVGLPLPILPIQILWVNILEEGFLTFGFAFEPGEKKSMQLSPRALRERTILTKPVRRLILVAGTITGIFSVGVFLFLLSQNVPIEEIRTIMFVVLALDSIMFAVSLKQLRQPFWKGPLFNNRYLVFALLFSAAGIGVTLSVPLIRDALGLVPLGFFDVAVLVGVALVNVLTIESVKYLTTEQIMPERAVAV